MQWLRDSGAEVKREAEGAGDSVRIMTVHGAKGLQAPLVILPDTSALPPDDERLFWARDPGRDIDVPLWVSRKELRCVAADRLRGDAEARRLEEHNRLLYVALTRAEDRLLVCGCDTRRPRPSNCWYDLVAHGFAALPDVATVDLVPFPAAGPVLRLHSGQTVPVKGPAAGAVIAMAGLPAWAGASPDWRPLAPPAEELPPRPLAPSRPDDAEMGPVPHASSPLAARAGVDFGRRRGQLLHALLQHLPALPRPGRHDAARKFLARPGHYLTSGQVDALAGETIDILEHPDIAPLFGPDSRAEVPLTGLIGGAVIGGLVDRLAVLPDRVLVADYKTNRAPPAALEDTPVLYLRQMAAYRAVLGEIFPGRAIACALIWTRDPKIAWLPPSLLDRHTPGQAADGLTGAAAFPTSTTTFS